MADLLDIAPSTAVEVVTLDEKDVEVRGVSINTMASIISQFPDLKNLAGNTGGDIVSLLISGCGAAIGPIIAAGVGQPGNKDYEQHAAQLLPEQQIKLLRAILGLTFPNGIGSFVTELTGLMNAGSGGAKTVRLRSKNSQSKSPPSAEASDSHPTMQ